MAEKILNTRIQLKRDTLTNWNESSIVLKPGELAVAYVDVATTDAKGNIVHVPTAILKAGENVENSTKTFKELPFVSAIAADVYAWAKKEGIEVIDEGTGEVISDVAWDATRNALVLSRIDVVTPIELTNALQNYYTKGEIDALIAGLSVGALEGRIGAVETAVTTTLPGQIEAVDAKFADYTKTEDLPKDLGNFTNNAGYAKTADINTELDKKADKTQVATDIANAIAPLATTEALNNAKSDLQGKIDLKADIANVYTKDDIDGKVNTINGDIDKKVAKTDYDADKATFALEASVAERLSGKVDNGTYATDKQALEGAIALKADQTALENYYTKGEADAKFADATEYAATKGLVDNFFSESGAENVMDTLTEIVTYIESDKEGAIQLGIDVEKAKSDAAAAVSTANAANTTAGEAKTLAEEAKEAATNATTGAAASAAAALASQNAAAQSEANALASENAAAQAKADAEAAKGAAEQAKADAEAAKNAASGSAANAATSESNAAGSAATASEQAGAASASAANANTAKEAAVAAQGKAETAQGKAEDAQSAAEAARDEAVAAKEAAEASNTSATAIANQAKETANGAKTAADAATEAVAGLHAIAKSGNVNDLVQTSGDVLIFDCGTSTLVI